GRRRAMTASGDGCVPRTECTRIGPAWPACDGPRPDATCTASPPGGAGRVSGSVQWHRPTTRVPAGGETMIERTLGRGGLRVSAIGLGCMGMSEFYDPKRMDDAESIRVIHRYLDAGGNFLDTADVYGIGRNEVLVGEAIRGRRDRVVLATKFANVRGPNG